MRCGYCHNPDIVKAVRGTYPVADLLNFLSNRINKLEGVVLTGGEATLYPNLLELSQCIKYFGYHIKLDTNGTRPKIVAKLLKEKLIDYVALDYKAPPEKFKQVTGSNKYQTFSQTLDMLCAQKKIPFEIRTTVHTDLLNETDVQWILADLAHRNCTAPHYIQNYTHTQTLGNLPEQSHQLDITTLRHTCPSIAFRNFP